MKAVGTTAIVLIGTMMGLREIRIDATPIIAGAGVVALAIAFGTRSLTKCVIAGCLIILEGRFAVGDVIKTGELAGQVEQLHLRVTALLDIDGAVHFIPNGEMKVVSNLTKEWSRVVLNIGMGYDEDIDRVVAVLESVGREPSEDQRVGTLKPLTP